MKEKSPLNLGCLSGTYAFIVRVVLCGLIAMLFSGCIGWHRGRRAVSDFSPSHEVQRDLDLAFDGAIQNLGPDSAWHFEYADLVKTIKTDLQRRSEFRNIQLRPSSHGLVASRADEVYIQYTAVVKPSLMEPATYAVMTLGIVPFWTTHELRVTATLFVDGQPKQHYSADEQAVEAWWLPFVIASPFVGPTHGRNEALRSATAKVHSDVGAALVHLNDLRSAPPIIEVQSPDLPPLSSVHPVVAYASGTGFLISDNGYILTCNHVIEGGRRITVHHEGQAYPARVLAKDSTNDVALLKIEGQHLPWISLASSARTKLGTSVFAIGFPNSDMGVAPKYSRGDISSLKGLEDTTAKFQISVPIQPGSSGSPLLTMDGFVVGMVTSSLNPFRAMEQEKFIPQNVNYAIKSEYILAFLASYDDGITWLLDSAPSSDDDAIERVEKAVVLIEVGR